MKLIKLIIFILFWIGLNQELKELKKKHDITEDEYSKSQKTFNNEKSELIRHYEQRVINFFICDIILTMF